MVLFAFSALAQVSPAVAANMKFAFEEIKDQFSKKQATLLPLYMERSGKLVTQIRSGAPFDIFFSADVAFTDSIVTSGFNFDKPRIYAYGKLVLWTCRPLDIEQKI